MSADLHIHAMTGVEDDDLACFTKSNGCGKAPFCPHWKTVSHSPSVWIGEVSWLKAGLFESDCFIPEPVQAVQELIGNRQPVLDAELRDKLLHAIAIPNERAHGYRTTQDEGVVGWLDQHMGQRLFTVSW